MSAAILEEVLTSLHVITLPMKVKFRGIETREIALFEGPFGWGEFSPFLEYGEVESLPWLMSGIEAAFVPTVNPIRQEISINATLPEIDSKIRINQNESNSNDLPSTGLNILSFLIPLVGLILYIIEKDKSPIKAKSAGKSALWGVGVSVILIILSVIVTMVMINRINRIY